MLHQNDEEVLVIHSGFHSLVTVYCVDFSVMLKNQPRTLDAGEKHIYFAKLKVPRQVRV